MDTYCKLFRPLPLDSCWWRHYVYSPSVRSSGEILLQQYLMNGLNSFDKTDREYSLAPTDDLIWCWRSKVTAGSIMRCQRHPRRCWDVNVPSSSFDADAGSFLSLRVETVVYCC